MARVGVLLGVLLAVASASADTITVDRTDDPQPAPAVCTAAPGDCSLRGAVLLANGTPATEIALPAGTYALAGPLDVTGSFAIVGAGAATTVVDGGGTGRVMVVRVGAGLVASKVGFAHGGGSGPDADGGAVKSFGTLTLVDAAVRDSTSTAHGGGISNSGTLVLTRSVVSGNTAATDGGGIWSNAATLIVRDSTLDDNHATAGAGGGIAIFGTSTTRLDGSTLSANTAGTIGGGLINADFGAATLTDCTVSGNTAGSSGGGVDAAGGTVTLASVTVTSNTSDAGNGGAGGGGLANTNGTLVAWNSIVAGNRDLHEAAPDCSGVLLAQQYNLIGNPLGCDWRGNATNLVNRDPQLGPLAGNGGPTMTHVPQPTSPAVDAADPTTPGSGGESCPDVDQRGVARPQPDGGRCDIGAVESATAAVTSTTATTSSSTTSTSTSTTTNSTTPPPVEICDDCIDNDGNGLTDLEDPTCCTSVGAVALELGTARFTPGSGGARFALNGQFSKLDLTGTASTQDVLVQVREEGHADFLCARIPAANLVRRGSKETFKDPKRLVASARGIDALRLKRRKNGNGVVKASGAQVPVTLPSPGVLRVTVGILQPGAAEAANRCASVGVPFTVNRKDALLFRNP